MKKKFETDGFCLKKSLLKILLTMKFTFLLFLLSSIQVFGTVYSQETKLSIKLHNVSLFDILDEIENQSEYKFLYNNDLLENKTHESVNVKNNTIEQILDNILEGTGSKYSVLSNNLIVISPVKTDKYQYQNIITGKITSENGDPLIGATVVVKGTTIGTITDIDGSYSLSNIPSGDVTLVFSFIGYISKEVVPNGSTLINVTLKEDVVGLEEVVVVGYGTVKKSDLTGSVSTVGSDEIAAYPTLDATQAIQGRAAGVQITANNGEPGSSYKVRIRGGTSINSSSDPLYVIDGFPGGTLPPAEDIESIEVLKDASATAIYGSRGANGVIMVTTKRGKSGETKIEFNTSLSSQKEINRLDLLEAQDFVNYINEATPGTLPENPTANTDWQDMIFQTGFVQNYKLSFSGGNDNVRYYVSGNVYDHKGIVINSKYKRYSLTSNVDFNLTDKIKLGANIFARRTDRDGAHTQEGSGGTTNTGIVASAFTFAPSVGIYDENGEYTVNSVGDPRDNPYAIAKERKNNVLADLLQANLYGELTLLPSLKLKGTFGAKTYNSREGIYVSTKLNAGSSVGGAATINSHKNTDIISESYLTYSKLFNDVHEITAMGGMSYQSYEAEYWNAYSTGFITDDFSWWNIGGGSINDNASSYSKSELMSYYGRINYKFNDKYLITLNGRYDGSSRFAKNNKWAFFPSGAFAWNVTEEDFMKKTDKISMLKLRGSYGITGNQAIDPYESLARYGTGYTIINGSAVNSVVPTSVANDNLTWESTAQLDIGFDFGLFDQRIYFIADYYHQKTTDLLFEVNLPEYSGFSTMLDNIGSVENKGIELTLSTVNIEKALTWKTNINFSLNRNKITELPDGEDIYYAAGPGQMNISTTHVLREGQPVGTFFGYVYDGVYQEGDNFLNGSGFEQEAGGEKFKDLTGEGDLDSNDRTIIGNPNPKFIWGMNNSFAYKNFDLDFFLQGSQGNDIYSFTLMELESMLGVGNSTTRALNRWSPTNTDTNIPKANSSRSRLSSSRWIMDGSYIRLKNISLGYTLPKNIAQRFKLNHARVYVSAQNLFTITSYRGYDPEVNYKTDGNSNSNKNLGLDYGSYPNAKTYTMGLQIIF